MKILFVTPYLPYPPMSGWRTRVYQLMRGLAGRHDVTLLSYRRPEHDADIVALREIATVHPVMHALTMGSDKRRDQLTSLLSPASYQWRRLRSTVMQQAISRLLAAERFDLIQVESSPMAGFDFGRETPVLIDEHNIEYELLYRLYQEERSPARKLYYRLEYTKFRREELRCWQRSAGSIFTSEREEQIFRGLLPNKPTITAPNGVDIDYFSPADEPADPDSIVFTGLMSYRPNVDAVLYFVREVLPLIVRSRPNARFTVVGASVPEEIRRLAGPNVAVTGTVPDVRPYLARAGAVVVPLRMGSGTRLKVLEGLAMGKAMVSTSLGCEGIDVADGDHLLIADEPPSLSRAILRLLDDPALGAALGRRGRALTEAHYSWPAIVATLEGFYDQVLHRERPAVVAQPLRAAGR